MRERKGRTPETVNTREQGFAMKSKVEKERGSNDYERPSDSTRERK